MNKIRVMFAMGGNMKRAGAETMVMQYLRQLIKNKNFEFSILVHGYDKGDYDDEINAMGVPIYHVPIRGQKPLIYSYKVKEVFNNHPVDIIHCNMDSACGDFLYIAKKCGIKIRIAHSHTTQFQAKTGIKKVIGFLSRQRVNQVSTIRLACSSEAGEWLYRGKNFKIIHNAIELQDYIPNDNAIINKKLALGISCSAFVIGNVGRLCYEKNQKFLIDLFCLYKISHPNSKLLLIGEGRNKSDLVKYATSKGCEENVLFLGLREDVPSLLQIMDVYVMPSLFEGLPVSGIEAQAAGLPCLFSDNITPEICMTDYAKRLPLGSIQKWNEALENIPKIRNVAEAQKKLQDSGFDIKTEAEKLTDIYFDAFLSKRCDGTSDENDQL